MEKLKKQLEDIKGALPLMIKLGAIDQSAYKTLNEALDEALQQCAVMQRSEQLKDFAQWIIDNTTQGDGEWLPVETLVENFKKSFNCA